MRIIEIEYSRTINLGNYENKTLKAKAVLDEKENGISATLELIDQVDCIVSGAYAQSAQVELPLKLTEKEKTETVKVEESTTNAVAPEKTRTRAPRAKKETPKEDNMVDQVTDHIMGTTENIHEPKKPETTPNVDVEKTTDEVVNQVEKITETKPETPPEVKPETPKKVKGVIYSRNIENHKIAMASVLDQLCPTWRQSKTKEAGDLSKAIDGKEIIFGEDGEVPESFKQLVRKHLGL